ncbi:MAG: DUF4249 family protein [Balneolaceae bacterium]|nr:MAG: DUF4249 family protein [Balneolaceae bacterium]
MASFKITEHKSRSDNPGLSYQHMVSVFYDYISGRGILFTFAFSLFTLLISCNDTFEPFQENDRYHFSIYGFLDANADTQWVRVSPVREQFEQSDRLPDMNVTIENIDTGEKTTMTNSLVEFRQGFYAANVWSDFQIEENQTYRLVAERTHGGTSYATVTIPPAFPTPRVFIDIIDDQEPEYFIWIDEGVERLADVQSWWYVRIQTPFWQEDQLFKFSLKAGAEKTSRDAYRVQIFPDDEIEAIMNQSLTLQDPSAQLIVLHHQIFVASGGPDWDVNITHVDDLVYNLPEGFSNVENGLGYMAGVFSRLIPFKECFDGPRLVACPEERPYW